MQDLKVTVLQTKQFWEDKAANFAHFEKQLAQIELPTDMVVLPEMFHTGFTMNAEKLAENMDGDGINWLHRQAEKYQAAFVASLIIRENGNIFNRMVFVEPNGKIATYDKRKRFTLANEDKFYAAGSTNTIVEYKNWKIALQVCYDLRFPELCRNAINAKGFDYDVLVYVANWPERRNTHWRTLLAARAIENQCYVVGVNRVGEDANGLSYSGNTSIISALGEELLHIEHEEKLVSIYLSKGELSEVRAKLPFLKDR